MENKFANSLNAESSVLLLIDYQRGMFNGVESCDRTLLKNNVTALARGAKVLGIPTVLTTISEARNGHCIHEITDLFTGQPPIERARPVFDALDEPAVNDAVKQIGRKQFVLSGLWTSMCFAHTALHGLRDGYDVFGVIDAAGSESKEAHDTAVLRMVQAGIVPTTWEQVIAEWMKSWANPLSGSLAKEVFSVYNGYMGVQ